MGSYSRLIDLCITVLNSRLESNDEEKEGSQAASTVPASHPEAKTDTRVRRQGARCMVQGVMCRVHGVGWRVKSVGCRVWGVGCVVWGVGWRCRVWGIGCGVCGVWCRV